MRIAYLAMELPPALGRGPACPAPSSATTNSLPPDRQSGLDLLKIFPAPAAAVRGGAGDDHLDGGRRPVLALGVLVAASVALHVLLCPCHDTTLLSGSRPLRPRRPPITRIGRAASGTSDVLRRSGNHL